MNSNERALLINKLKPLLLVYAVMALLAVIANFLNPGFLAFSHWGTILRQMAFLGIVCIGQTLVILTGGIDLSVGSVLALTTAFCASFIKGGMPAGLAMLLALVIGTAFGTLSGILVTKGRLQPFIATLITMTAFRGITMIFMNGKPISGLGGSFLLKFVGKGSLFGIPFPVILFVAVFALFMFVLEKTVFGRRIYSTGSNAVSAKLAGVNIDRTKLAAYAISGCMAALSGLILLSRLSSAQPTLGEGYELDAIASVALGGTSMNGGRGRIWGTFVGVLIIAVLNNGLNILGVSSYYQSVVKAIVILIAVLSDRKR